MRGISSKPVTKEDVVETLNKELIPLLREMRKILDGLGTGGGGAPDAHASSHASGGSDELVGETLDISIVPTNYTRVITAPATALDQLGSHLGGIDDDLGEIAADVAAVEGDITAILSDISDLQDVDEDLQDQIDDIIIVNGHNYCFYHLGPSLSESVERRMFPGYTGADRWASGTEWTRSHHIIASDGAITQMVVRHPTFSSGSAQTLTYTIFLSPAGGAFAATGVSGSQSNSNNAPFVVPCNIAVSAGDRVGISITFGGNTVMNTTTDNMISASLMTTNTP